MADLMIKGGRILKGNGAIIENGVIVVENGLITFVGKETKEKAEKILDVKGCIVAPGLINAHTHLSMTLLQGYAEDLAYDEWTRKIQQAEAKLVASDVRAGAYLGILEMICSGTTAFADMYIHMDEVAQAVERTGMRASLGYGMIEGRNESSETKLKTRRDFNRKWNGKANGRITTMYAPHSASSCSREFLIKVREIAKRENSRIHIHVLETEKELNLMKKKHGMCSINLLDSIGLLGHGVLAAHCVWLSEGDIHLLKERDANVVHCPSSNMTLGTGIAPVPKMLEKGVNVALGTDSAASSGSLDMWKEMRCASLLHKLKDPKAMPASTVFQMATVNGARALGINAGALEPGYLADIVIVDMKKPHFISPYILSSLVQGTSRCDVRTTIVNGNILMEDHKMEVLDKEKVIQDAVEAISKTAEYDRA